MLGTYSDLALAHIHLNKLSTPILQLLGAQGPAAHHHLQFDDCISECCACTSTPCPGLAFTASFAAAFLSFVAMADHRQSKAIKDCFRQL